MKVGFDATLKFILLIILFSEEVRQKNKLMFVFHGKCFVSSFSYCLLQHLVRVIFEMKA